MFKRYMSTALAFCGLAALLPDTAYAQTVPPDLDLQAIITTGLSSPLSIRAPNDGSGRLFILEQGGAIKIWKPGTGLNATAFLTVPTTGSFERGLLGMTFHPNFANNGRFFVQHTRAPGGTDLGPDRDQITAEYRVSIGNPDIADPSSRVEILRLADYAGNHNGGDIHFGSDGYLYVSMGDGGDANDTSGFSQCQWRKPRDSTPANCSPGAGVNYALLGKILRIDIDQTTTSPGSEMCGVPAGTVTANYAIPPGNPNVASSSTCDEIWHFGLRNPWRFSFDRQTSDMIIADVGQNTWEEVNFVTQGISGLNFGYRVCEGAFLRGSTTTACSLGTLPVLSYGRAVGGSTTGGFRYRGAITELRGMYIYGDFVSGRIFFGKVDAGAPTGWSQTVWRDTTLSISGFGEDANGEIYLADYSGAVYRFVSPTGAISIFANGFE
jgi:glucose/arabinose dehydrogenase